MIIEVECHIWFHYWWLFVIRDSLVYTSLIYSIDNSVVLRKILLNVECFYNLTLTNLDWLVWNFYCVQTCLGLLALELAPPVQLVMTIKNFKTFSSLRIGPLTIKIGHYEKRRKWWFLTSLGIQWYAISLIWDGRACCL